jgi:hypothetical protein
MEWDKAAEIKIWLIGHKKPSHLPDIILKKADYKLINSGLLVSGVEEEKIDFFPNHRIMQVRITP